MQVRITNVKLYETEYTRDKNWFDLAEYTLRYPVVLESLIERYCPLTGRIFLVFATTVSYTRCISTRITFTYLFHGAESYLRI